MKADIEQDDMPAEIDFSNGTRGRFAGRLSRETTLVALDPDIAAAFPSAAEINTALRGLLAKPDPSRT